MASFLGFSIPTDDASKATRETHGYLADELSLVKQLGFIDDSSGVAKPVEGVRLSDIGAFLNWVAGGKEGPFPPLIKRFLCTRLANMKKATRLPNATQEFKDGLISQLEQFVKDCEKVEVIKPVTNTTTAPKPVGPAVGGLTRQDLNAALKAQQTEFQKALNAVKTQQDTLKKELSAQISQKVASLEARLPVVSAIQKPVLPTAVEKTSVQPTQPNPKSGAEWFSFTRKAPKQNVVAKPVTNSSATATATESQPIAAQKPSMFSGFFKQKNNTTKKNTKFSVENPLLAQTKPPSIFSRLGGLTQKTKKPLSSEPPKFPPAAPAPASTQPTPATQPQAAKFSGLTSYFPKSSSTPSSVKEPSRPVSPEPIKKTMANAAALIEAQKKEAQMRFDKLIKDLDENIQKATDDRQKRMDELTVLNKKPDTLDTKKQKASLKRRIAMYTSAIERDTKQKALYERNKIAMQKPRRMTRKSRSRK